MAKESQDVYTCDSCGEQVTVPAGTEPKGFVGSVQDTIEGIRERWFADKADCIDGAVKAVLDL